MYTGRQLKNEAGNKVSRQMECGARQLVQIRDERKTFIQQYPSIHFISKVSKPNDKMQTLSQMYNGLHTPIARPMTIQMLTPFIRRLLKGSAAGAILGSIVPGIGNLIGGAVGAITSLAKELIEAQKRERIAEEKGVTVSDDISGFILAKVEDVLKILPLAHLKGNGRLRHIKTGDNDMGNASSYDGESTINICNPLSMPDFLYALLSKKYGLIRYCMDKGSIKKGSTIGYGNERQYNSKIDEKYMNSQPRHVMAGVSEANSQEKLLSWTLRHEIGHSIDQQIHWQDDYSKETMFGGWEMLDKEEFLDKILKMVRVNKEDVTFKTGRNTVISPIQFLSALDYSSREIPYDVSISITGEDVDNKQILKEIKKKCFLAFNHPWMFDDGCIDELSCDNKIYMYDEYGNPCSYRADQRKYAVSNYQFAAVNEWFAEAYAAFYNPDPNAASRERLSNDVKKWFTENLGGYNKSDRWNSPAAFITKNGTLTAAYKKCAYYLHEYTKGYANIDEKGIWYKAIQLMNLREWEKMPIAYEIYDLTKSDDSIANYYAACKLIENVELTTYRQTLLNERDSQA